MKNILKNIFLGALAAIMLLSCNMELTPFGSIVYDPDEPLILTETDVVSFQNGVMARYRSLHYGGHYYASELMCDGFNAVRGYGNNYGTIHMAGADFTPSNQEIEGIWGAHYTAIKDYNIAIAHADRVPEELKSSAGILKGMALFCRASSYLHLARHWGLVYNPNTADTDLCVPLVLEYDQMLVPERATVKQVYDQIFEDLNTAEGLLAMVPGVVRSQYPTLDAVRALKARYYLDIQDFDKAVDYADAVITSAANYALASTEAQMHLEYTAEAGTEPIMQLYSSMTEGLVGNTYYLGTDIDEYTKFFSPYYIPTKALITSYDKSDIRLKSWYCLTDDAMVDANTKLTPTEKPVYPLKIEGSYYGGVYVFQKYRGNPALYSSNAKVESGAHSAKTLLISEMYLIAAEAAARDSKEGIAKTYLNALQKARQAVNTEGTLDDVKKEWFRETVGEGMRLACIKRWGDGISARTEQDGADDLVMPGTGFAEREMPANSHVFNWPIPTYEIQIHPNLIQNPNYESE